MTDEQKTCNHKWRKAYGGYCSECYLTRKEEREYNTEIQVLPDTDNFTPQAIRKPENLKLRFAKPKPLPLLTEEQMGCPASAPKRWNPEGYLHGDRSDFKPQGNGHA